MSASARILILCLWAAIWFSWLIASVEVASVIEGLLLLPKRRGSILTIALFINQGNKMITCFRIQLAPSSGSFVEFDIVLYFFTLLLPVFISFIFSFVFNFYINRMKWSAVVIARLWSQSFSWKKEYSYLFLYNINSVQFF